MCAKAYGKSPLMIKSAEKKCHAKRSCLSSEIRRNSENLLLLGEEQQRQEDQQEVLMEDEPPSFEEEWVDDEALQVESGVSRFESEAPLGEEEKADLFEKIPDITGCDERAQEENSSATAVTTAKSSAAQPDVDQFPCIPADSSRFRITELNSLHSAEQPAQC
jgi:hypothetical protein